MKNIKKYIIGIAASICLTQCDVLDVDPTGWYSENVAYSSHICAMCLYLRKFHSFTGSIRLPVLLQTECMRRTRQAHM